MKSCLVGCNKIEQNSNMVVLSHLAGGWGKHWVDSRKHIFVSKRRMNCQGLVVN